jgi:predicted MFS family arabinose efflux permease
VTGGKAFQMEVALVLFGVLFLGVSDTQLVAPLLPLISEDLGITPGHAGILVTSYSLAAAAFALLAGALSDRVGRKRVLTGGLVAFAVASFSTYHVSTFEALVILRAVTGFAAGTLSTTALSFAGDHYAYAQRGRAMGILSMSYFVAFAVGIPLGGFAASRFGWHSVFGGFAALAATMFLIALARLPADSKRAHHRKDDGLSRGPRRMLDHFRHADRVAGILAAFLTSGGLVGFLTYVGAWLNRTHHIDVQRISLLFMASGIAAIAASPVSGWLSDHAGKRNVIIWSNVLLAIMFVVVERIGWGVWLVVGIAILSVAASARQAPLHALTTEIVGSEIRGEYMAMRNAASQLGIATIAAISAVAFDSRGFSAVALVAAIVTILIPACCLWLKEPGT